LALELFERVLKSSTTPADQSYARQLLTLIKATSPKYEESRQALERFNLVEKGVVKPISGTETADDLRSAAQALALQRAVGSKREDMKGLEAPEALQRLGDTDKYLPAQLPHVVGVCPRGRAILVARVGTKKENSLYISYLAESLLRHSDVQEAGKWVS